jgi:nitrate reductase NapE component
LDLEYPDLVCAASVLAIPAVVLIAQSKKEFGYRDKTSLKQWAFLGVVLLLVLAVSIVVSLRYIAWI